MYFNNLSLGGLGKDQIYSENKAKSGVYRWVNLINGKSYIGSSVNLSNRLRQYYSKKYVDTQLKKGKSAICSSIRKYGLSNFKLEILEYCPVSKVLQREDDFFKLFKPENNFCKKAGNCSGRKHSEKTKKKIGAENRGRKPSEETRAKLSASMMGNSNGKNNPNSLKIQVTDLDLNTKTTYPSIREAARALNINPGVIAKYFGRNQIKPVLRIKKRYAFAHLKK